MLQTLERPYKVFEGDSYRALMPQLREAGLLPMSMADVMRARLEGIKGTDEKKSFWLDRYIDTGDGVGYNKGKVKIVPDAQPLRDITPNAQLSSGALILTPEQYRASEGQEFSRRDLERAGLGARLSKSKVESHPVWRALARDKHLLSEYADTIFAKVKQRYDDDEAMGVYLGSEQKVPTMRAWFVYWVGYVRSYAYGGGGLGGGARLVGVNSESAEGAAKNQPLDERVAKALREGQAFEFNGQLYVPVQKGAKVKLE